MVFVFWFSCNSLPLRIVGPTSEVHSRGALCDDDDAALTFSAKKTGRLECGHLYVCIRYAMAEEMFA